MKAVTYSPLSTNQSFTASVDGNTCTVVSGDSILKAEFTMIGEQLILEMGSSPSPYHSGVMMEYLLTHHPEIKLIKNGRESITRSELFQNPALWHHTAAYSSSPVEFPARAPAHQGYVYRRYIPHLGKTISFRLTNPEKDLETFHEWHNQPRVSFFWELNKPKEELKEYMEKGLKDPHQIPMIVEIDNDLVGYYEMYWVKEDRLGPYYESENYDRGFHFLIGSKKYLGFSITDSIIKSGLHLLFLDDQRTKRIMAEPRSDNQKVLKYAEASIGWTKLKEFDFPHKRAALLENRREVFFGGNAL